MAISGGSDLWRRRYRGHAVSGPCGSRRRRYGALACLVLVLIVSLALGGAAAQRSNVAAIVARLQSAEPLTANEVRDLIVAAREALGYKSVRLSLSPTSPAGVDLLMGADGRPLFTRETGDRPNWRAFTPGRATTEPGSESITLTHYTRRAARRCDGTLIADELVVEYRSDGAGWSASTRLVTPRELGTPIFKALSGEVVMTDAGRHTVTDRGARGLQASWSPPELQTGWRIGSSPTRDLVAPRAPASGVAIQVLSIDEQTLLPLRWSLTPGVLPGLPSPPGEYQLHFTYDPPSTLSAPAGVDVPSCVP